MNERLASLLNTLDIHAEDMWSVSGGDINDSYRIKTTDDHDYFVKMNRPGQPKNIITSEIQGLKLMHEAGVKIIPHEFRLAENNKAACLVMPFYSRKEPTEQNWVYFFEQMAHMHMITEETFGGEDNFIGLLHQNNSPRNNWVPFFRDNRLEPQFRLAQDNGYFKAQDEKIWQRLYDNLPRIMPIEKPSLIHGDLWGGNVLPTEKGILLIDPCPYYGHREMDFGMMELFSGIPVRQFLGAYENIYPLQPGLFDRIELYQLYYILVHLNLFGSAYLPGVQRIIRKFSG